MSCGSTTCTSIPYDLPVLKPFSGFERFWRIALALLAGIGNGCERSHQRQQLLDLDDRLLADIGITRDQAVEDARKSFWIRINMPDIYR
jgi:uncharacterized protein YjiS (DUF1127 family)